MVEALADEDDLRFRIDFVWGPVWGAAGSDAALDGHMPSVDDGRVRVWYDDDVTLHTMMAAYSDEPAPLLDHYFIYEAGTSWEDDPGEPNWVSDGHAEGLDEDAFIEEMLALAPECDEVISE